MLLNKLYQVAHAESKSSLRSNSVGLLRSGLALSLFVSFLCTPTPVLMGEFSKGAHNVLPDWTNFFHLLAPIGADFVRIATLISLAIVISGWRPFFTSFLHAWIANSFVRKLGLLEGGDMVHANLSLFLILICISDFRKWHWCTESYREQARPFSNLLGHAGLIIIRIQVAVIYLHAAMGKFMVKEWVDGSAVYYWSTHAYMGANPLLLDTFDWFFRSPLIMYFVNWGVLILELFLFAGIIASKSTRKILFLFGVCLHFGIWVIHGLASFGVVMVCALAFYLLPVSRNVSISLLWGKIGGRNISNV